MVHLGRRLKAKAKNNAQSRNIWHRTPDTMRFTAKRAEPDAQEILQEINGRTVIDGKPPAGFKAGLGRMTAYSYHSGAFRAKRQPCQSA